MSDLGLGLMGGVLEMRYRYRCEILDRRRARDDRLGYSGLRGVVGNE